MLCRHSGSYDFFFLPKRSLVRNSDWYLSVCKKAQSYVKGEWPHDPLSLKSSSLSGFPLSMNDNIYLAMLIRYLGDIFNHHLKEIPYQCCFLNASGTSFVFAATTLVQAIISYLDECTSLLNGLPPSTFVPFHSIFYKAMRMTFLECGSVHLTSLCLKASIIFHCLWDKEWTFVWRALLGLAPVSPPASSHTTCFFAAGFLYFITGDTCPPPIETLYMCLTAPRKPPCI